MIPIFLLESILDSVSYKRTKNSSLKHTHVAIVYKRGKILAVGKNKLGTRSRGSGWNTMSIHAEIDAIKNLGDTAALRGASIIVVRINTADEFVNSEPCKNCKCVLEKCMKSYGLEKVYYS